MADKRLKYMNRKSPKYAKASPPQALRVKITGAGMLSFEDLTAALHRAFAKLEGQGAAGAGSCSLYLNPQSETGAAVTIRDEEGRPQDALEIHVPARSRFAKASAA